MSDFNLLNSEPLCIDGKYVVWRSGDDLYFVREDNKSMKLWVEVIPNKDCPHCKNRFFCLSRKPTKVYG